jgi:hypothetical protein
MPTLFSFRGLIEELSQQKFGFDLLEIKHKNHHINSSNNEYKNLIYEFVQDPDLVLIAFPNSSKDSSRLIISAPFLGEAYYIFEANGFAELTQKFIILINKIGLHTIIAE